MDEILFKVGNVAVLPGWMLLVAAPRWKPTATLICPVVLPGVLAAGYAALLVGWIGNSTGDFHSLAGVAALFERRELLLAGWWHYLAFDLIVGSWEVRDAQQLGVKHLLVVPCLVLTLLCGPLGWLCYMTVRGSIAKSLRIDTS